MHPETITSKQRGILKRIPIPPDYYMAGGTALALQIGHRMSVDFDFFSSEPLSRNLLGLVEERFGSLVSVVINESQQLTVEAEGVGVTYLHYPFPVLLPLVEYEGAHLLCSKEIAATKAYTLGRRATFKDYVDLYFLFKESLSTLDETLELAKKKYADAFDARLFLEQLVYFEDVPTVDITFLRGPVHREEMERFFAQEIQKIEL